VLLAAEVCVPSTDVASQQGSAPFGAALPPLRVITTPPWHGETVNPYRTLLYEHVEALGYRVDDHRARALVRDRHDIWHVHWISTVYQQPDPLRRLARAVAFLGLVRWQRWRGARIVWTLHDIDDNDGRGGRIGRWFIDSFAREVDGLVALTEVGVEIAHRRHPVLRGRPHAVVRIGEYRGAHGVPPDRATARDELGIPVTAPVVTAVGLVRRFKALPTLAAAFAGLDDPDAVLIVAGRPVDEQSVDELRRAQERDPRVRLDLRYVPDDVVTSYLAAADLVAMPAPDVHNSSSVVLGLSADRPVLAADSPTMRELRSIVGEAWLHLFDRVVSTEALAAALDAARPAPPGRAALDELAWPTLARRTVDFYHEVLASPRRGPVARLVATARRARTRRDRGSFHRSAHAE
jgi:beta-1,4-mannosyltransferase